MKNDITGKPLGTDLDKLRALADEDITLDEDTAYNPTDPAAEPIVRYTWSKLWNAKAFNACSGMPRIGHKGILTMEQLQDVMALLLDPKSPVNQ